MVAVKRCWFLLLLVYPAILVAEEPLANAKPVPALQALPLPRHEVAFTRHGKELTRYLFDPDGKRTFFYPIQGAAGRSLTRMGHPRDPQSHSHHNSVWISHHQVNGVDFWGDQGKGRIEQKRIIRLEDSDHEALLQAELHWLNGDEQPLIKEIRTMRVQALDEHQWWLLIDLELQPALNTPVTLGATPFGFLGVRMAKTIGVHDGGGTIRNSAGQVDEAGVFRQPAKWVDYSGPITSDSNAGITLMDHPQNFSHPTPFHVRDDGWMGASPTLTTDKVLEPGQPLLLRYALFVHSGVPSVESLEKQFATFAATENPPNINKR
jgi:Methane oxygenase PmoA